MKETDLKVTASTFTSLALLILGIINLVLTALGKPALNFGTQEVTVFITALYTLIVGVWAWWKNHNVSKEALTAQVILDGLKQGLVDTQSLLDAYEALVKSKNDATADAVAIKDNTSGGNV